MQLLNNRELQACYFDNTEIEKIMFGDKEIWSGNKVIDLGSAQSWNIQTLYPNLYDKLTSANFFFASVSSVSELDVTTMRASDTSRSWGGFTGSISKSYNSSTGVLTAYSYIKSKRGNVRMYLVTKPEKLIYLGNGNTFNVRSREDYASYVANNFLLGGGDYLSIGAYFYPAGYDYSYAGTGTLSVSKSYNASTGVFTSSINLKSVPYNGSAYYDWSTSGKVSVYLNPKIL